MTSNRIKNIFTSKQHPRMLDAKKRRARLLLRFYPLWLLFKFNFTESCLSKIRCSTCLIHIITTSLNMLYHYCVELLSCFRWSLLLVISISHDWWDVHESMCVLSFAYVMVHESTWVILLSLAAFSITHLTYVSG